MIGDHGLPISPANSRTEPAPGSLEDAEAEGPRVSRGLILALAAVIVTGCHGHVIRSEFAPNHGGTDFDFGRPRCEPAARPAGVRPDPDTVLVRYLGAAGLFIQWGEHGLLAGPFFSNPGLLRVAFGKLRPSEDAVAHGLKGIPLETVLAIFAGHSHYDHLGDVPLVASREGVDAILYVNSSGARMLASYPDLAARTDSLERHAGRWVVLSDSSGTPAPIRFMPVPSDHAPPFDDFHWADGEVEEPWSGPWLDRRVKDLRAGRTFALVFDLLSQDRRDVRFRIYYQDAASGEGRGYPPPEAARETHPYDIAVLCMPPSHMIPDYPRGLLRELQPRHVLVTHYEDFFRDLRRPVRFESLLTDKKANLFLEIVRSSLAGTGQRTTGPAGRVCGPSSSGWTMPLPGEWMEFRRP